MISIYNTLSGLKTKFKPLVGNTVSIYVCGVTVYDLCHIGHARTYIVFDLMVKYLRDLGYDVNYVRNITDIDDKIINRANSLNISCKELTDKYIAEMYSDLDALNIARPDIEPKATDHIDSIINLINTLLEKKHAYVADTGDVLFNIASFPQYGSLSKQDLSSLHSGARVAVDSCKLNPHDFVLWKSAKSGEISWDSPWGAGRPGWHIECSAMNLKHLGAQFDIHGGGSDLLFPHHENEIAQSCCANTNDYVNYWMHSGMVMVDKEKMSKSLGNFFTIRDVLQVYSPEVVRYFLISAHYRSQINYTSDNLDQAASALSRLYSSLRDLQLEAATIPAGSPHQDAFTAAMNDDFNTPLALASLFDLSREINSLKKKNIASASNLGLLLVKQANILGLLHQDSEEFFKGNIDDESLKALEALISDRNKARLNKEWSKADSIRKLIFDMGFEIEDKGDATTWRRL